MHVERMGASIALESVIRRLVAQRLVLFAGFSAVWAVSVIPVLRYGYGVAAPWWLIGGVLAFVAGCGGACALGRRGAAVHSMNSAGVSLAIVAVVLSLVLLRLSGEVAHYWVTPLILIGAGVVLLHRAWLIGLLAIAVAIILLFGRPPSQPLSSSALVLAASCIVSMIVHEATRRMVFDVEDLRLREQAQRAAVEEALAEARRQLVEREVAEAERASLREQLGHAQRMESLGTLAGGLAHDMNNVLGGILGVAEMMRDDAPASLHDDIDSVIEATKRGAELTRNLLGFARRGKYRKLRVELSSTISELLRMLRRTVPKGVEFVTEIEAPSPAIDCDPSLLAQALMNLSLNSVDAMRGVGTISIVAHRVVLDSARGTKLGVASGEYVAVAVSDTGMGMSPETVARIFEPFFTTKELGRGTGLGLSMVHGTVTSYGGGIAVESRQGVGTTITLYFPAAGSAAKEKSAKTASLAPPPSSGGLVLLVDDDPQVARVGKRILEGRGYTVLTAADGQQALAVYQRTPGIDLVILDMAMPVMGGRECFVRLREHHPGVRVLLVSGYTIEQDARACLDEGAIGFVEKPFTISTLLQGVMTGLSRKAA